MTLYRNGGHHTKALPLNNLSEDQQYYEFYIKCPLTEDQQYDFIYPTIGISPYNTLNYSNYYANDIRRNDIL